MIQALRRYKLDEGADGAGVSCDEHGIALAGTPLLTRTAEGFEPRSLDELETLVGSAYHTPRDAAAIWRGLSVAARALSSGDVALAKVATLHLRLESLDEAGARRLAKASSKFASYNPDQPRDWHGRWSDGNSFQPSNALRGSDSSRQSAHVISSGPDEGLASGQLAAPAEPQSRSTNHTPTGSPTTPERSLPQRPNQVRIDNPTFHAPNVAPDDVPSVVREFIASGLASQIWWRGEGDGRELSGDVQRRGDDVTVEDARWGEDEAHSGVRVVPTVTNPAPPSQIPFYFHTHSDAPSLSGVSVYPGPSKKDVDNSRNYHIWQVVMDKDGYVYVINPQGGFVRSDGSVVPYEQAVRVRMIRVAGEAQESYPSLEDQRNAYGHVRNVRRTHGN